MWGYDTNDTLKQIAVDMNWTKCLNGSETGWAYYCTDRQLGSRLENDTLFANWRNRVRTLGGELWRRLIWWGETGLETIEPAGNP